jgi:hypothetical protein
MPNFAPEKVKREHHKVFLHRGYTEYKASKWKRHLSNR